MAQNKIKTKVLFPIGVKLVVIISILFLASLGAVIMLVSAISTEDVRRTAEYNNFTINRRAGSHAESAVNSIQAGVLMYLSMVDRIASNDMEQDFFSHNRNIAAIWTETPPAYGPVKTRYIPNESFLLSNDINENTLTTYFNSGLAAATGIMMLTNASPTLEYPLLSVCFIRENIEGNSEIVKVVFSPEDLSESFGTGTNTSFIVTDTGDLLLHPDTDLVLEGANLSSLPVVASLQQGAASSRMQISFTDDSGESYFSASYRIPGTDATVITTIPFTIIFEAVNSLTKQNIFLAGIVLFMTILFIWFFSKTISNPVRALAGAALQIESGDFNIDLKPKHKDEIGLLTESFGRMTGALNIFGRFVNKDIALLAMRGEIKPGGLPKHATIFFSDIRGFTEKSESFTKAFGDEAPDRIVHWLNEYLSEMVICVEKTGGVVDKFIGDAVMAHWGTASTAGSPEKDAFNAVKASLMMRSALNKLNQRREKDDTGNPIIQIGCGLNTGIVTAGQIGSEQRMEYTVIGDPVNLASRVESLNKPFGTDILIAEDTWKLVGDKFITEEMPPVSVKGKTKPVKIFAVVNLIGADGPQTLAEARKMLGIKVPSNRKADINAEEKKYKIQES